ncbi:MAG TPA: hypothetical protein VGI11_17230 [Variovorax sp.]
MNTIPHHLGGDPEADLKLLYQRRQQLMLEREIARKGRQARRELDRQRRLQDKRRAKTMARVAVAAAAATETERAQLRLTRDTGAWSLTTGKLFFAALLAWAALVITDPLQLGADLPALAGRYALYVGAAWAPANFACYLWRRLGSRRDRAS